jgi:hypothetical protein
MRGRLWRRLRRRVNARDYSTKPELVRSRITRCPCVISNSKFKTALREVSCANRSRTIEHELNQGLPTVKEQIFCQTQNILKKSCPSAPLLTNLLVGIVREVQNIVKEKSYLNNGIEVSSKCCRIPPMAIPSHVGRCRSSTLPQKNSIILLRIDATID